MGLETKSGYKSLPSSNQFEVTLIGTGGGYGESIVAHLGNEEWLIVDSCQSPNTDAVLPLEYLESIGVNLERSVKLIVCTHWHDDHIHGMSKVLTKCTSASMVFAKINDTKKFLRLVGFDVKKLDDVGSISSTKEFNECIDIIEARRIGIKTAGPDRLLYTLRVDDNTTSEVHSLSPSDEAISNFDSEISQLITEYGESRKKIIVDSPNDKSVVLYLKLGKHNVLLGADLELTSSDKRGWLDILNNSTTIKGKKASYFKIPHHGSKNGYHEKIWIDLLESDPNASLTPWNKGKGLPTPEMLAKMKEHTKNLYITSPKLASSKPKKRDRDIEKIIDKFKYKLSEVKFSKGLIRNRIAIGDTEWTTEVFDSAFKI